MRGLDGSIVGERRARRYYGTISRHKYVEGVDDHLKEHRFWCHDEEKYKVPDKMNWYVKRVRPPPLSMEAAICL
jgi:hypothetical protein